MPYKTSMMKIGQQRVSSASGDANATSALLDDLKKAISPITNAASAAIVARPPLPEPREIGISDMIGENAGGSSEEPLEMTHMVDNESCVSIVESMNNEIHAVAVVPE